jgi:hypothetical protein
MMACQIVVEKWSRDGLRVELMLYADNSSKAHRIFERTTKHRPRIRLMPQGNHSEARKCGGFCPSRLALHWWRHCERRAARYVEAWSDRSVFPRASEIGWWVAWAFQSKRGDRRCAETACRVAGAF